MPPLRLGVLATHPIQYFSPLYRRLDATPGVDLTVYFAHRPSATEQGVGFGLPFEWDVDLTSGYRHVFLTNRARKPDLQAYAGVDTPEIGTIVARERFDAFVVSGWNTRSYWQAMRACWRTDTPVLVRGDSQLAPQSPVKALVKRLTYPRFMRRFAACLAVGQRSAEYFRHYGARRVVSSPHFVDNDAFAERTRDARARRSALRARWGIAESAFVPLFAGKFIEKKRPADLIEALTRLGSGAGHALFVGDGELRARCEAMARERGVDATFAGFLNQTEIAAAFAAADVLVLPSDHRETWGLVVNEAMAGGLPALVSDACGCAPDLIIEGRTGHVFPLGDVATLAARLATLASDRAHLASMAAAAVRHVSSYSVSAAAEGVVEGASLAVGEPGTRA